MPNTLSLTPAVPSSSPVAPVDETPENYTALAFWNQYNVILLGGAVLFSIALASFVPLVLGALGEVVWLGIGARSAAFKARVARRKLAERRGALEQEMSTVLATLEAPYQQRFAATGRAGEEITQLLASQIGLRGPELEVAALKLDEVRVAFLRFSAIHQRLSRFASETPLGGLEAEVARIREQFAAEKDLGVRVTIRQSLVLAERRLRQWEQIGNTRRAVEVQLDTLEKSFAYVKSRAMGFATPAEMLREIEALVSQVSSVSALEAETQEATRFPSMA